ncbi:hypothetical protein ABZW10_36545 [Kitasatospora sp. NPDC004723]|uniref:hypothetical protein n=1 Tax=Kitasatospora sp. NPDC004723 TaxID=3154288 RepID=UPI0033BB12D8
MSDTATASDTVTALVPDIDEVLDLLHQVDDPLVNYLQPVSDEENPDEEDWQMPETLDVRAVDQAWTRILQALPEPLTSHLRDRREEEPVPGSYTLLTGAGYQRASLYPVTVDRADLAVMTNLLDHLRRALPATRPDDHRDLSEALDQVADRRTDLDSHLGARRHTYSDADVVRELEVALDLLGAVDQDADAVLLLKAIGTPQPDATIELRGEQAEAYGRWTGQLIGKVARSASEAALIRYVV